MNNYILSRNGLFLPRDLGLNIILDPLNPDGKYTVLSDGSSLANITDIGITPSNQSQATAGAQPIYKQAIINGQPVFRFSGSQWMSAAGGTNNNYAGAMTIFTVFSTTNANPAAIERLMSKISSWSPSIQSNEVLMSLFGTTYTSSAVLSNNTFYNFTLNYNGSSKTDFYKNGTLLNTSSAAGTMSAQSGSLFFGSRDGTQHFFSGDMAFFGVKFGSMSVWQMNRINFYLNTRFKLS